MSAMPPKQQAIHGMPLNDADANKRLLGPKFSGIFKAFGTPKKHRKSQLRNEFQVGRSGNGGVNQQRASNVNGKQSISPNKKSRRFKRPATPEHELFTEYKESSTNLFTTTTTNLNTALTTARTRISEALTATMSHTDRLQTAAITASAAFTKPIEDALLRVRLHAGTPAEKTYDLKLSEQMARFNTLVGTETDKLKSCWREWEKCRTEIRALVGVAKNSVGGVSASSGNAAGTKNGTGGAYAEEVAKLMQEYCVKRDEIITEFDETCEELGRKRATTEKAFVSSWRKKKQEISRAMEQIKDASDELDGSQDFDEE